MTMTAATRFILLAGSILLLALIASFVLSWYALAPAALLAGALFPGRTASSFTAGFLAGALLWGGYALYLDNRNGGILSARMGDLFAGASSSALLAATALLGGLLAGLSAWTGSLGRALVVPEARV